MREKPLPGPVNDGSQGDPYVTADASALYFSSERGGAPKQLYRAVRTPDGSYDDVTQLVGLGTKPSDHDMAPVVTDDELTLYWASDRKEAFLFDIYVATRPDRNAPFSDVHPVAEVNTAARSETPTFISADGCRLYYSSSIVSPYTSDIYVATKPK